MRIEFDPTNPTEAAAVRAMLTALTPRPTVGDAVEWQGASFRIVEDTLDEDAPIIEPVVVPNVDQPTKQYPDATLDSTGTPWDDRIHSTPATTNKDGTWRAKRGVTADQIAAVRAEREATPPVALAEDGHIEEAEQLLANDEPLKSLDAPTAPPAPPVTTAPPAPIVVPAPLPTEAEVTLSSPSFLDVMKAITAAQKDGKIDTAKVKELCAAVGAGESTMGLNGPDNGERRVAFMALLAGETK